MTTTFELDGKRKKEEEAISSMVERKDMLILAQQKLDEMNRFNLGLGGVRPGSVSSRSHRRTSAISTHILSSLLYIAMMLFRVEDMKAMLREEDGDAFSEWRLLLDSIHSPEFHARERVIQNKRVKSAFERKHHYKQEATLLRGKLNDAQNKLSELQNLANVTSHQMSKTINVLQDERAVLIKKQEDTQLEMSELHEKVRNLTFQVERLESESIRKDETIDRLKIESVAKDEFIKECEAETTRLTQELAVAKEKVSCHADIVNDMKEMIEKEEDICSGYRLEAETLSKKLQQELEKIGARNESVNEQLACANELLCVARDELKETKVSLGSKLDSFDLNCKCSFDNMASSISQFDCKLINIISAVENDDTLAKVTQGNNALQETMLILSDQSRQIEKNVKKVNERVEKVLADNETTAAKNMAQAHESFSQLDNRSERIEEILDRLKKILTEFIEDQISNAAKREETTIETKENLESFSIRIEDTLRLMACANKKSIDDGATYTREVLSMLEGRTTDIRETLTIMNDSLSAVLKETKSIAAREAAIAKEAVTIFDSRSLHIEETMKNFKDFFNDHRNEGSNGVKASEVLSRIECEMDQVKGILTDVKDLLTTIRMEKLRNDPSSCISVHSIAKDQTTNNIEKGEKPADEESSTSAPVVTREHDLAIDVGGVLSDGSSD